MRTKKPMNLTALLIVEDLQIRSYLSILLKQHFKEIKIIEKYFENVHSLKKVNDYSPDIVFCEIDMSTSNPFELISSLPIDQSNFIFISNKENPMLKAIQFATLNYLIKPFSKKNLTDVMQKVLMNFKKRESNNQDLQIQDKISLSTHNGYTMVNLSDIAYITSSGNYCTIVLLGGEKITLTKLIGDFEKILPEDKFPRVHQSYIVNINHISRVINDDGLQVVLQSGSQIPVARRRKKELFKVLGIKR